jgi:single-strand DNA-binding protein
MDINKVVLIGRLVRDADLKYTKAGSPVSKFSIACNKKRKQGEDWVDEVNYFDIVLWGRTAESLNQYLLKGKQIAIDGELKQERWQDRGAGNNRSKVTVTALNIQLLGSGTMEGGEDHYGGNSSGGYGTGKGGEYSRSNLGGSAPSSRPGPQHPIEDDGFTDDNPF